MRSNPARLPDLRASHYAAVARLVGLAELQRDENEYKDDLPIFESLDTLSDEVLRSFLRHVSGAPVSFKTRSQLEQEVAVYIASKERTLYVKPKPKELYSFTVDSLFLVPSEDMR